MYTRTIIAYALTAAAALPLAAAAEVPADQQPRRVVATDTHRLEEVADGVYFVRYTVPRFNSNALVVVNDEDVLVVDSHITPATARALIASIREVTDKPITTVVNTHFHYDHAHGNQAFGPVTIIGHEFTRMKMAGAPLAEQTYRDWLGQTTRAVAGGERRLAGMEEGEARARHARGLAAAKAVLTEAEEVAPVPPDTTLRERMTLVRGDREIQIVFCGRAHTGGDVVVYLPKERLVFTGDMMLGGPSWLGDGFVDEWPATLAQLKTLDFDLMLPGHGPAFRDRELIDHVAAYYRDLWAAVVAARAEGKSIGQTAAAVDLTRHKETLGIARAGVDPLAVGRIYALLDERGE